MTRPLSAVILNDTSTRYHHGCARVMRLLVAGLERQGLRITARSPARHDWQKDESFLTAMRAADVIVINGEGTLHHGAAAGAALLEVTRHPARADTPVALVNALWQDNPDDWAMYLERIDLLAARDSESAAAMERAAGHPARWLPDLSLSAPSEVAAAPARAGVIVGDSVKFKARQVLARAADRLPGARFIPTKTLKSAVWRWPVVRGLLYRVYNGHLAARTPRFEMPRTGDAYLEALAAAELHITGRFHAVCLSMLVETPFLALTSNASKIERLLADAGLGRERMVTADALQNPPAARPFTAAELDAIRAFRAQAQEQAEALFADIAALARSHAGRG